MRRFMASDATAEKADGGPKRDEGTAEEFQEVEEVEEEEPVTKCNPFAALMADGESQQQPTRRKKNKNTSKPKPKAPDAVVARSTKAQAAQNRVEPSARERKRAQKPRKPTGWSSSSDEEDGDVKPDEETGDEEQRTSASTAAAAASAATGKMPKTTSKAADEVFVVRCTSLDPIDELRAIFGSAAVMAEADDADGHPVLAAAVERRRLRMNKRKVRVPVGPAAAAGGGRHQQRSLFSRELGAVAVNIGMTLREVPASERVTATAVEYRFVYSPEYMHSLAEFLHIVESGDPDALVAMYESNPMHIDTVWQLSEMYRMNHVPATQADLLAYLLALFEGSWGTQFKPLSGSVQLPWAHEANRVFLLALWRRAETCVATGAAETALNVTRLLLALDRSDPLGAFYMLDSFALRKERHRFILAASALELHDLEAGEAAPLWALLPNWAFSRALAAHEIGRGDADELLGGAATLFPNFAVGLLRRVGGDVPPRLAAYAAEHGQDAVAQAAVLEIYVQRNQFLWKADVTLAWLVGELSEWTPGRTVRGAENAPRGGTVLMPGLARHVVLTESVPAMQQLPAGAPRVIEVHDRGLDHFMETNVEVPQLDRILQHMYDALLGVFDDPE